MDHVPFSPSAQVSLDHYTSDYDDLRRWTSYWYQLDQVRRYLLDGPILEIGIGNGVTTSYLRTVLKASVTTVDIDSKLNPDVVADVADLPFQDGTFGCVVACQVLEHTPYKHAEKALKEFRRVGRNAVISVPDANRHTFQLRIGMGSRQVYLPRIDLSKFLPKAQDLPPGGEHYWEIGRGHVSSAVFDASIRSAGWQMRKEFRNPDFPYHHFYILEG